MKLEEWLLKSCSEGPKTGVGVGRREAAGAGAEVPSNVKLEWVSNGY